MPDTPTHTSSLWVEPKTQCSSSKHRVCFKPLPGCVCVCVCVCVCEREREREREKERVCMCGVFVLFCMGRCRDRFAVFVCVCVCVWGGGVCEGGSQARRQSHDLD